MRAAARQACLGLVAVVVSLPLLWALQRRFGLAQGSEGVLLVGASVLLAFIGGGLVGAGLHEFGRGTSLGRRGKGGWIAPAAGLLLGLVVAVGAGSYHAQSIVEDAASEGASRAWQQRGELLDRFRATQAATTAAKELAVAGAAQLPVLVLLAWAPLGSMLGAALEYRLAARR